MLDMSNDIICGGLLSLSIISLKPLGICKWSVKTQIFDHLHLSPIDIALKKLSLP